MKQRLDKHFLLNRAFVGTLLAIAVPIALQNMISFGVAVMDSVMLGSFGDVAIAAANLGGQPFSILMSFGFGLSSGGSVLIAQYWGKGDIGRIRKVMRISMQLVFLASLGITVVCLLMPEGILRIFTKDEAIVQAGAGYLALVAFSYIPYSLSNNYMMSLRAVEKVKISTAIYGVSFFVNVFFNYAFIFGKFGAPRLEVRGAAVGTIFARCSELVMVLIYMYFRENTVGFRMHDCLKFDREMLPSYTRHSLPVLGNELLWGVGLWPQASSSGASAVCSWRRTVLRACSTSWCSSACRAWPMRRPSLRARPLARAAAAACRKWPIHCCCSACWWACSTVCWYWSSGRCFCCFTMSRLKPMKPLIPLSAYWRACSLCWAST